MTGWGSEEKAYEMETLGSYEWIECPKCGAVGQNNIEKGIPVNGHPNVECAWLICECGHALQEIT